MTPKNADAPVEIGGEGGEIGLENVRMTDGHTQDTTPPPKNQVPSNDCLPPSGITPPSAQSERGEEEGGNALLNAALHYRTCGWSVFPIKPKDKKHPLIKWKPLQERLSTDDEVKQWWGKWPDANIGLVTGAISDLIVLDIDSAEGREEVLKLNGGALPHTPTVITGRTGGAGRQLYFKHPGFPVRNSTGIRPGLDLRGDRGYVVAPSSIHPSGREYEWEVKAPSSGYRRRPNSYRITIPPCLEDVAVTSMNRIQGISQSNNACYSPRGELVVGERAGIKPDNTPKETPLSSGHPRVLIPLRDAAAALCMCRQTLMEHVRKGDLPCVRMARNAIFFKPSELEKFVEKKTVWYRPAKVPRG